MVAMGVVCINNSYEMLAQTYRQLQSHESNFPNIYQFSPY